MQQSWLSSIGGLVLVSNAVVLAFWYGRQRRVPADAPRTWMMPFVIAQGILVLVQGAVVLIQLRQPDVTSYERRTVAGVAIIGVLAVFGLLIRAWWLRYRRRSP